MILQNIRVPKKDQCPDTRAYYLRSPEEISFFKCGDVLDLTSYFNCFSISKWFEYTGIQEYYLKLNIMGRFDIDITSDLSDVIYHTSTDGRCNELDICLQKLTKGLISIRITALSDGSSFNGGYYYTKEQKKNNVKLALNVCTYKREEYVHKKICGLLSSFSENGNTYADNVEMFIVDNAGTFDESLNDDRIHIFKNRNYGGSGGYARGLYEIRKLKKFTHVVFIDDDTYLDFESVYRLFSLLSYIKEEWKESLIGGAMIRSESPTIIYATSATMTEIKEILNDNETDISEPNSLLTLNNKNGNYNGWWFCCSPHLGDNDLPAPMFVSYDDVEYGVRYNHDVILLNGISVWHDSFDNKYSVLRYYYDYRNMMIARAMTGKMTKRLLFKVLYYSALETLYTRYDNSDIFLRGIYDFFKGPEFIESIDPEVLNDELISIGQLRPLNKLSMKFDREKYEYSMSKKYEKRDYLRSILTLNGIILPSKYDVVAPLKIKKMSVFYRAKRVLHCDENGQVGFITEIDKKRALKRLFLIPLIFIKYSFKIKKVSKKYTEKANYLHSEKFWKKYLGLN